MGKLGDMMLDTNKKVDNSHETMLKALNLDNGTLETQITQAIELKQLHFEAKIKSKVKQ